MTELKFFPYAIAWGVLLIVVIVLAVVRSKMAAAEDDTLKLSEAEAGAISAQVQVAKKLSTVESVGKWLTVLLVVSGVILAGLYGWSIFTSNEMFSK